METATESFEDRALRAYEELQKHHEEERAAKSRELADFLTQKLYGLSIDETYRVEARGKIVAARIGPIEFQVAEADRTSDGSLCVRYRWVCEIAGCNRPAKGAGPWRKCLSLGLVGQQIDEYHKHVEFMHGGRS